MPKIIVTVPRLDLHNGQNPVTADAIGFAGTACKAAIASVVGKIGQTQTEIPKPELGVVIESHEAAHITEEHS